MAAWQARPHSRIHFATGSVAMDRDESALLGLRADPRIVQGHRRVILTRGLAGHAAFAAAVSAPRHGRVQRPLHANQAPRAPRGRPAGGSTWACPASAFPAPA